MNDDYYYDDTPVMCDTCWYCWTGERPTEHDPFGWLPAAERKEMHKRYGMCMQQPDEPTLVHQSWEGKDMPCVGEQWVGRPK